MCRLNQLVSSPAKPYETRLKKYLENSPQEYWVRFCRFRYHTQMKIPEMAVRLISESSGLNLFFNSFANGQPGRRPDSKNTDDSRKAG